jgi:hypothetical protein
MIKAIRTFCDSEADILSRQSPAWLRSMTRGIFEGDRDAEMVAIAGAIIKQRTGTFDPSTYTDRYQEGLREVIEAKMKGLAVKPRAVAAPAPVIDLMAALKRSLAKGTPGAKRATAGRAKPAKAAPDRRQTPLLLPLSGGRKRKEEPVAQPTAIAPTRRRKG